MDKKTPDDHSDHQTYIAIVGPCGAGKSTLADGLKARGFDARQIAQEHSYVPTMWKRMTNPSILIYLDVSFQPGTNRKQFNWTVGEFEEQIHRLAHARSNCDIYIHTDNLTPGQVLSEVLKQL